jgi:hypothetical protein
MAAEPSAGQEQRDLERLRARVDELERELAERTAKAEAAVAAAQEKSYWLDRLRIDMNAVMRNPVARAGFEVVFFAFKALQAVKRRLR